MSTLIRNGLLCFEDRVEPADLLVRDEAIAEIAPHVTADADEIIDAAGAFVLPGMIDIHTHLADRIGNYDLADDYLSGTRVAVQNGITTVATFITETTDHPLEDAVACALRRAENNCYADHWWHLTPIRYDDAGWEAVERLIAHGFRTWKFYTTYRQAGLYCDYDRLEWILSKLSGRGIRVLLHCEDDDVLASVHLTDDTWQKPLAHALSRPPQAEVIAVREVLRRAERYDVALHIVHVSLPDSLELIADARASVQVTCETCPQYLFLDQTSLQREDGHRWICSPPLRSLYARRALAEMALNGAVDLFATDHCAFTRADKDRCRGHIPDVPNGIAGIGALPHLVYALFAQHRPEPLTEMARYLAANPARLLGTYPRKGVLAQGSDADFSICRAMTDGGPVRSSLADVHETYPGETSRLWFERVFVRGREVVRQNTLLHPEERRGKSVWPT